jgi:hypothetical protein
MLRDGADNTAGIVQVNPNLIFQLEIILIA